MEISTFYLIANVTFTPEENELRISNIAKRKLVNNQYAILLAELNIQQSVDSKQFQSLDSSFNYYLDHSYPLIPESYKFRILTATSTHIVINDFGQISEIALPLNNSKSQLEELIRAKVIQEVERIKVGKIGEFYFQSEDQNLKFPKIVDLLSHLGL
jgi:hypothetical protein